MSDATNGPQVLVKQDSMIPTRKVTVGGLNGASAVVGLNLLATVVLNRVYGGYGNVPEDMLQLVMWVVSSVPVAVQWLMAYVTPDRVRLASVVQPGDK